VSHFRHGLVVGKFYPPHAGHHALIATAAAACDRVTVVVAQATSESIPLHLRLAWLAEVHADTGHVTFAGTYDDHPIDYTDPAAWEAHCAVFRAAIRAARPGDEAVDAVFSSEAYGDELARRFGARHVCVDPERVRVRISGTAVRADPTAHWDLLAPAVRAWFARRVVVVGAESTGTTTLARALARHFRLRGGVWGRTGWVPEYGRALTEQKLATLRSVAGPAAAVDALRWTRDDFVTVVREQNAAEEAAARAGSPLLVCDTDAFATAVWEERYLGAASPAVLAAGRRRVEGRRTAGTGADLYLLTSDVGVPFTDDGMRDGEHLRSFMTGRFRPSYGPRARPGSS